MLVLPLIIWWARSPDPVPGRPRIAALVIAIVVTVSACGYLTSPSFADDRYNRGRSVFGIGDDDTDQLLVRNVRKDHQQLREGTLIPPTVGQIVMLGRRWAFVPSARDSKLLSEVAAEDLSRLHLWSVGHRSKPRPTRLGGSTRIAGSSGYSSMASTLVRTDNDGELDAAKQEVPHVIVAENLMLQRIVEAIRADATDDRWSVSGEVTEFFNENRLLIRTAQRANPN